jgi:hypothetical protein
MAMCPRPIRSESAAVVFAAELAADRVPAIRAIRAALRAGQPRAQRLRQYLAAVCEPNGAKLAAHPRYLTRRSRPAARMLLTDSMLSPSPGWRILKPANPQSAA